MNNVTSKAFEQHTTRRMDSHLSLSLIRADVAYLAQILGYNIGYWSQNKEHNKEIM